MTPSDLMRKLADLIDGDGRPQNSTAGGATLLKVVPGAIYTGVTPEEPNTETMVPPLQQKPELMKKIAGEESVYDDDEEQTGHNDLEAIKKNAGLVVGAADEPFEG